MGRGRPPRNVENADEQIRVRCTSEERRQVDAAVVKRGQSMSELVREALTKIGVLKP